MTQHTYIVNGMTCQHCVQTVQTKLTAVTGVTSAKVQLLPPRALVEGEVELNTLQQALNGTQFTVTQMGS